MWLFPPPLPYSSCGSVLDQVYFLALIESNPQRSQYPGKKITPAHWEFGKIETVSFRVTKAMWTKAAEPQAVIQLFEQFDLVTDQHPCNHWNKFLWSIYDRLWHSDRGHRCLLRLTVFVMISLLGDHWYGSQFCKIGKKTQRSLKIRRGAKTQSAGYRLKKIVWG